MIKLGLVGCGMAGLDHIREIKKLTDVYALTAVADLRPTVAEQTAKEFNIPAFYTDCRDMLARESLDALAVVTSADGHHPVVLEAAKAKLPVLCEKPIANSVAHGREMIAAMAKAGKLLAITYTYRFVPDTRKLKEIVDCGILGDLVEVRYIRLGYDELAKPAEGTEKRRNTDVIYTKEFGMNYDCGVHAMDLMRWYSGSDAKKITAQGICRMGYDYPDAMTAVIEMENGVRCLYEHGSMPNMTDFGQHVFMIILTGRKGCAVWRLCGRSPLGDTYGHSSLDVYSAQGTERHEFPVYTKHRDTQYRCFAQAVQKGTLDGTPFPKPEDTVKATEMGLALVQAAKQNLQQP